MTIQRLTPGVHGERPSRSPLLVLRESTRKSGGPPEAEKLAPTVLSRIGGSGFRPRLPWPGPHLPHRRERLHASSHRRWLPGPALRIQCVAGSLSLRGPRWVFAPRASLLVVATGERQRLHALRALAGTPGGLCRRAGEPFRPVRRHSRRPFERARRMRRKLARSHPPRASPSAQIPARSSATGGRNAA
jgi:hypothetical protein